MWATALKNVLPRVPLFQKKILVCFPDTAEGEDSWNQYHQVFPLVHKNRKRPCVDGRLENPIIQPGEENIPPPKTKKPPHTENRVHLVRGADALDVAQDLATYHRPHRHQYRAGVLCPADALAVLGGYVGGSFETEECIGPQELLAVRTTMLLMNRFLNPYPWHPSLSGPRTMKFPLLK